MSCKDSLAGRSAVLGHRKACDHFLHVSSTDPSQRLNDDHDPDHGRRAAALAQVLDAEIGLPSDRRRHLCVACALHADGAVTDDPTVGTCWDADRLNLWRVGLEPDPGMLSTAVAREPATRAWSRSVHAQDMSWREIEAEVMRDGATCRKIADLDAIGPLALFSRFAEGASCP